MPANPYDEVPYVTRPQSDTHPDRLAAVGMLFGMQPAPVTHCRVLEIGCGDGSNLLPMAYHLPESRFTGVDLAPGAIATGRQMAADLELGNLTLTAADLCDLGPEAGEFDYIIAHGVYSWVPEEVREALLAACAARLAPQGIAFISYNAYPGRYLRQMLREAMLYATRRSPAPLPQAREFLTWLRGNQLTPAAWRGAMEQEIDGLLARHPAVLWHDEFSPDYAPFYFHEFAGRAAAHGLQYLGDAETHLIADLRPVAGAPGDPIEREQWLDFQLSRRFRETLLCRAGIVLERRVGPERMEKFLFAAPCRIDGEGRMEGLHGVRLTPGQATLERVAGALGNSYPLPLPFEELVPYAGDRSALEEILFACIASGYASFHVYDFPCEETVTDRPRASRLARYQAVRSPIVTNVMHTNLELDEVARKLISLLDGSREVPGAQQVVAWMARVGLLE